MANYISKHTGSEIDKVVDEAVLFTEQSLTDEQKTQARENIGAGTEQVQSDLSQTDSTQPDYVKGVIRQESLPEGYPYKEQSEVAVVAEQTVAFSDGQTIIIIEKEITAGKTYRVTWDGQTETAVAVATTDFGASARIPFGEKYIYYVYDMGSHCLLFADSTMPETATVGIFEFAETITTIAPEYLPVDTTPTEGSTKPVTSGGVYAALDGKQNTITGTAGQVVGFDAEGNAVAQEAPSGASVYTGTIGTSWTENEDTGVKSQTVSIQEITSNNTAKVDVYMSYNPSSEGLASFVEEQNQFLDYITNGYAETINGGIKFYIFGDANTVNIPIVVEVV